MDTNSTSAEDYARWRPSFHLLPLSGWINDPCAPGYDPNTGFYQVSFQCNPTSADWGNIHWGTAFSRDLASWTVKQEPTLWPERPYDHKGVFTGCLIPPQQGDRDLAIAYTSVKELPIHHTLPHPKGCESLSLAKSSDGGNTWVKVAENPILPSEPVELDVSGWRDPYVAPWPRMANLLGLDSANTLFGVLAGGIREQTPTPFLYAIDVVDLTKWQYLGPLVNCGGMNRHISRWSGDLGRNWEVVNFLTLHDETDAAIERDLLVMGVEACLPDPLLPLSEGAPPSAQLWMSGPLIKRETGPGLCHVEMHHAFGGYFDHGSLYAANGFFDPKLRKYIFWGWIHDDGLDDDVRRKQGWSGMLALPRETSMQVIHKVVAASRSDPRSITSIECEEDGEGSYTIRTLASQPVKSVVELLRQSADPRKLCHDTFNSDLNTKEHYLASNILTTKQWEIDCVFHVSNHCQSVGFSVHHTQDSSKSTRLFYSPEKETFSIAHPTLTVVSVSQTPKKAPHTLFTWLDTSTGERMQENLRIRAWRDNSVLEVFINGRTAISTRIYQVEDSSAHIEFFTNDNSIAEGGQGTELLDAKLWDGIGMDP